MFTWYVGYCSSAVGLNNKLSTEGRKVLFLSQIRLDDTNKHIHSTETILLTFGALPIAAQEIEDHLT